MPTYYGKNGELRLYDANAIFIVVRFSDMNFTGPFGAPRPEEILRLNRGQLDSNTHYVQGLDDPVAGPVRITTSFKVESGANRDTMQKFLGFRYASKQDSTWTAGSAPTTLITTKGTSSGRPAGLTGTLVTLPLFTDPQKVCVNLEVIWDDRTGSKLGVRYTETYFDPGATSINEAPDMLTMNLAGDCYGQIFTITAFTSGTELVIA
jgi:hypothetical protein